MLLEKPEHKFVISSEFSKRINIVKVWFTMMILFIHSYSSNLNNIYSASKASKWLEIFKYLISQSIARCAVPGFFMISAILLYRKEFSWTKNMYKKIHTLLIPYLILNTFWILFYFITQHIQGLSVYFSNPDNIIARWGVLEWINGYLGIYGTGQPILYPLWFVRDLFVLNMLSTILKKIIDKFPKIIFLCLLVIWCFDINTHIFCINTQAICFFSFGYYIVKYNISFKVVDKINCFLVMVTYLVFLIADLLFLQLWFSFIIHQLCIIIGIIFWFRCSTKINNNAVQKNLLRISEYSFSIYIFHELNLSIVKKICISIFEQNILIQFVEYLFIPVFIFAGCIILSIFMQKVFPKCYSVLTGNRIVNVNYN